VADCIFCKIIAGEIPSNKVYEDDKMLAFRDINPEAPTHILFIPKKHLANLGQMQEEDILLVGHMLKVIGEEAVRQGLTDGYRVVSNCGEKAGQSVDHLHFHLLGGRNLQWPPG
jgi:histidine triad (HIT) family protein